MVRLSDRSSALSTRPPPQLAWARNLTRQPKLVALAGLATISLLVYYIRHPANPPSRPSRPAGSTRDPVWHDHETIAAATQPHSTQVAPVYLTHLAQYEVEPPFNVVYIVSAWLDPRPELVSSSPEVVLVATTKGRPFFKYNINNYESNPLHCFFSIKPKGSSQTIHFTRQSAVQPQDSPDAHDFGAEWIYNQYICKLEHDDGTKIQAWKDAEVFVTLSLPRLDPYHSTFLPVTLLPQLDLSTHHSGTGVSAVCLPPLIGDFYAPFLADYFAHYRALGFSKFYPYLLDPGPETLKVLRQLMAEDAGITPVRWGVPKGWLFSTTRAYDTERSFAVPPSQWGLPGMEPLPDEVEFALGVPKAGPGDVRLWYYGQGPFGQDCLFRAMTAGLRWVLTADFDEWLLLRPPQNQRWPPPGSTPSTSLLAPPPANNLFSTYARAIAPALAREWVSFEMPPALVGLRDELMEDGQLAAGYMFRSAFFGMTCRPGAGPRGDSGGREAAGRALGSGFEWTRPGVEVPFVYSSPVRHTEWYADGRRTKMVIDPWAWQITGIHMATMPYLQWAITGGPCALSASPAPPRGAPPSFDPTCAATLLRAFGPPTYLVDPGSEASNQSHALNASAHSQGALYHVRVHPSLRESLVEHERRFGQGGGTGALARREGVALVEGARVGPAQEEWAGQFKAHEFGNDRRRDPVLVLFEDWTFLDVMGDVLAALVEERRRRARGRWPLVGGLAVLVVAVAVAAVGWRRAKRRID